MKRIKAFLFSVLFVCCFSTVRASTNTVDYTSQLSSILSILQTLRMRVDSIWGYADSIDDVLWNVMSQDLSSVNDQIIASRNILDQIKSSCDDFKSLLQSSVSDLDSILYYVSDSSLSLQDLKTICDGTQTSVIAIDQNLQQVLSYLPDLSNMSTYLNLIQGQIQRIIDDGELNKEDTQRAILNVLTGITDQADSIKEALDIITQEGGIAEITDAIAALRNDVVQIYRILQTWDNNFFRYLYDRTFPNLAFEFYHISGSPFFDNGYLTYSQPIGPSSSFSFVDWLASALIAHTEGLQVINDNILFIAKVLGTNSQEQAMSEFQEEADDTLSTIQSQYTELINSSSYAPKQFDISKSHLNDVRSLLGGLSGQNSYESYKVHNLDFSSFESFGLPTAIAYQYDISTSSTFWEVCRAFFTCIWILLFAAVFFMFVRTFYHFYHVCFNALVGNRAEGYTFSSIPLHW